MPETEKTVPLAWVMDLRDHLAKAAAEPVIDLLDTHADARADGERAAFFYVADLIDTWLIDTVMDDATGMRGGDCGHAPETCDCE